MKVETRKTLVLTKEEQRIIHDLYKILDEDDSLDVNGVWDILADIYVNDDSMAKEYGYEIDIVD